MLSGVAQSAYKMCGDVRLLANLKEVEEPFAKTQVLLYTHALDPAGQTRSAVHTI